MVEERKEAMERDGCERLEEKVEWRADGRMKAVTSREGTLIDS